MTTDTTAYTTVKPNQKRFGIVQILAAVVAAGAGYGLAHVQEGFKIDALTEQRDAALLDAKHAKEGLDSEDKRIAILEARRQFHLALMSVDENDLSTAQSLLNDAGGLLESNGAGRVLEVGKRAKSVTLSGSVVQQRKIIEGFAREIDAMVIRPTKASAGAGQ